MPQKMIRKILIYAAVTLFLLSSCKDSRPVQKNSGGKTMKIKITSTAFSEGQFIPAKYTCDGQDISPPLKWDSVPKETRSIALICDDPDAPRKAWTHWVLYNLPPETRDLAENFPDDETLEDGARQGVTDFGKTGYGGPCPPSGKAHRYYFRI
jgi:Raf kinase inhibitor-like YbhB/YbcL family protein